jgi:hypothetical protein
MRLARVSVCMSAFLLLSYDLRAQTVSGAINGTVTDATGSVIPGFVVEAVNQDTGLKRSASGSEIGTFNLPLLPPGLYTVSITKEGFTGQVRKDLELLVNQNVTLDTMLTPSSVQQTVEVTSQAPSLDTSSATLGKVIEREEIVGLPLNGRKFTQLVLLTPGAAPRQGGQQNSFTVREGAGGISPSVNGQRGQQNNFTMDGVLNNALFTNIWAISPPPDAIQEFNVQSHTVDGQFSISSGANVNILTRSGTNQFHGALWEFLRNEKFDARNFFDPALLPYRQNQYGVAVGGPVVLPRYNGRARNTWVSGYWEGFRSRRSTSRFASVPTQAMRNGDFSAFLGPAIATDTLGRSVARGQIYDPSTTRPDPARPGLFLRDPFAGNIIPTSRLSNSALLTLSKYYPLPNLAVGPTVFPNLLAARPTAIDSDQYGIRLDHRFSNNDTLFGRFNYANPTQTSPEALPTYSQSLKNKARSIAVGYTHLLGPSTLFSLHYGYVYTDFGQFDEPAGQAFLQATKFDRLAPVRNGIPIANQLSVSQDMTGVSQFAIPLGPNRGHQISPDLSVVRGKHTIGIGGMYYHIHSFDDGWGVSSSFARDATAIDSSVTQTGLGAASFMLGLPDSLGGFLGDTSANFTTHWIGAYVQDKWQVSTKLTVTYGLRYDFVAPMHWKNDKVSALDVDTGAFLIPVAYPPLFPFPNVRKTLFDPRYNGFQPRFGLAWRAQEKTVIRAAFTKFDDHNNTLVQISQDPRIAWPWGYGISVSAANRGVPNVFLDNLPTAASFFDPLQPRVAFAANPRNKIPYVLQYNFGIQQQITPSLSAEIDYVGSVGRHLFIQPVANAARVPGPGPISLRQPYPQYGGTFSNSTNIGNSSYNALQAKFEKRMSYGVTFLGSYTYSKSLDIQSSGQAGGIVTIYDLRREWGPSDYDFTHIFVFSGLYQLPFGRGKAYLGSSGRFTDALIGGWNIGGITSWVSGPPFSISAGGDLANVGVNNQRAQVTGNPLTGFSQSINEWFNIAAFRTPDQFTYGNAGRNNIRGPAAKQYDFVAFKEFTLWEKTKLEFRGEFFNLPNHARFGVPNNNVQSSAFGKITSSGEPRDIQLALKLTF